LLGERGVALAGRLAEGTGRSLAELLVAEVLPVADACRFLERRARGLLKERRLGSTGRPFWLALLTSTIRREPLGVVLVLAPFNYPFMLPGIQALQGLAAGNAVVFKPGRRGTAAARTFSDLMHEAGLPDGLLQVLGEDAETGAEAVAAAIDKVVLTGSAETGARVAQALAARTVPAVMELSGNDPVFVLEGADAAMALDAVAYGLSLNKSQTCIAPRRVILVGRGHAGFGDALARRIAALPAVALDDALVARLEALLDDARSRGAELHRGGGGAQQFRPTLVTGLAHDHPLNAMDVFAPLTILLEAADEQEALDLARLSPYRLGASVFGPGRRAETLARKIDAGAVCINDVIVPTADPRAPFGGRGRSGHGSTRGAEGLHEMTQPKVILRRAWTVRPHLEAPWSGDADMFGSYLIAAHGSGAIHRARAGLRVMGLALKRLMRAR
jgi:acyl-CoA reductase-like NAD-dependent aldehyde dehydrogenase